VLFGRALSGGDNPRYHRRSCRTHRTESRFTPVPSWSKQLVFAVKQRLASLRAYSGLSSSSVCTTSSGISSKCARRWPVPCPGAPGSPSRPARQASCRPKPGAPWPQEMPNPHRPNRPHQPSQLLQPRLKGNQLRCRFLRADLLRVDRFGLACPCTAAMTPIIPFALCRPAPAALYPSKR